MKKASKSNKEKISIVYFIIIFSIIFLIIICENLVMKKLINKTYIIYNNVGEVITEKIIKPEGYKIHGIFNTKKKILDTNYEINNTNEYFNIHQGEICTLKTSSVKGETLNDLDNIKLYSYDENLKYTNVEYKIEKEEIKFIGSMVPGRYMYIFEIEYKNKDKLTYKFFLNVFEENENLTSSYNVEELSYKDANFDNDVYVEKDVASKIIYYMSNAKETFKEDLIETIPYKILHVKNENNILSRIDVWKLDNKVYFYKEDNMKYYELIEEYSEEFIKLIECR